MKSKVDLIAMRQELRALRARMQSATGVEQDRLLGQVETLRDEVMVAEKRRAAGARLRTKRLLKRESEPEVAELVVADDGHIHPETSDEPLEEAS